MFNGYGDQVASLYSGMNLPDLLTPKVNFGGHREAAVDHISKAMNELQQGIQFDKK